MESVNHYPLTKKGKPVGEFNFFGRNIKFSMPSLEEFIVRKTLADRRRALFGKDPFLG